MFSIFGRNAHPDGHITRREVMRVGGLGFTGLALPNLLQARDQVSGTARTARTGKAKACIIVYNYGGPSHLDTFDLKPDAPSEVRGEFKPIATSVPGLAISEHLPRLARMADRLAVVRSVTHRDNDHAIGAYLALTGYSHPRNAILGIEPPATPQDLPAMGSVVSKLRPSERPVFSYVTLGDLRHFGNNDGLGQTAGCLGRAHDPFIVPFVRPINGELDTRGVLSVMEEVDGRQLDARRQLLNQMADTGPSRESTIETRNRDGFTRRAFDLLSSPATRDAFSLSAEPTRLRDAYGPTPFAKNCLLARRLVEAGVPLVTVYSVGNRDWDTHGNNFKDLKQTLLPPTDRGLSALLEDLAARGLLDETLVVWMSEMGRTPRINNGAGRDHWSFCYSLVMAGGGIRGGQVYGSSDRLAAYPSTNPIGPADIAATIYHCLGIDPHVEMTDQQGRPLVVGVGKPIAALL